MCHTTLKSDTIYQGFCTEGDFDPPPPRDSWHYLEAFSVFRAGESGDAIGLYWGEARDVKNVTVHRTAPTTKHYLACLHHSCCGILLHSITSLFYLYLFISCLSLKSSLGKI